MTSVMRFPDCQSDHGTKYIFLPHLTEQPANHKKNIEISGYCASRAFCAQQEVPTATPVTQQATVPDPTPAPTPEPEPESVYEEPVYQEPGRKQSDIG